MIHIEENVSLKLLTTFGVGGYARYFASPNDPLQVLECLRFAKEHKLPFFLLGGGSNLVFPEGAYEGLIIRPAIHHFTIQGSSIAVGATYDLQKLIENTLAAGLIGLEFAAGIPGTVGGAIRGNAGTYGVDMGSVVEAVHYVNPDTYKLERYTKDKCDFRYRHSIFKTNNYIITGAALVLSQGNAQESKELIQKRILTRRTNHPHEPSAGCIFKNIAFETVDLEALREFGLDIDRFREYKKIPAGYLIETLGLKGKMIGGAQISPKHANYIINNGTATAEDITILISYIKQQVRDAYGIQLEEEVHIIAHQ